MIHTELRIGNYVSVKTTDDTYNVVNEIADGRSNRGWYIRLENVNHGVWFEHQGSFLVNGIEINTDWLVKFGFDSKGSGIWFKDLFEIHIMDNGKIYLRGWQNGICQVEYLHQLQNIYFSLTGYELRVL